METKANYVIVGIFTVVAIVAAFVFVYWTAAIGDRGETAVLRVRIPGSAAGLGRGSAVLFNGVKVGDVQPRLHRRQRPVDRHRRHRDRPADAAHQVDQGRYRHRRPHRPGQHRAARAPTSQEPKLLDEAEATGRIAEITANPSAVTNLLETAQDIFTRADKVLSNLEGFVTDVRAPLTDTINNAQKFSEALGNNADGVDDFLASVTKLSKQLAGASDKLEFDARRRRGADQVGRQGAGRARSSTMSKRSPRISAKPAIRSTRSSGGWTVR